MVPVPSIGRRVPQGARGSWEEAKAGSFSRDSPDGRSRKKLRRMVRAAGRILKKVLADDDEARTIFPPFD
jgi:hypothetical protein